MSSIPFAKPLGNMPPPLAKNDVANVKRMNLEVAGYHFSPLSGRNATTDFTHIVSGQPARALFFAASATAFGPHVVHVVLMGSEEQVDRVETEPCITMMTDEQAVGDWTDEEFVGESVSLIFLSASPAAAAELTVSTAQLAPAPQNTTGGGFSPDIVEEPIDKRNTNRPVPLAGSRAVFAATTAACRGTTLKDDAASLADARD